MKIIDWNNCHTEEQLKNTEMTIDKYINALRKCANEHDNDRTSTGHIRVSDLCRDTANLLKEYLYNSETSSNIGRVRILSTDDAAYKLGIQTIESAQYWVWFFREIKKAGLYICEDVERGQNNDNSREH